MIIDHKNLEYLMTSKDLNRKQAWWAEFLTKFNFRMICQPSKSKTKPDSFTQRPRDLPEDKLDIYYLYQY